MSGRREDDQEDNEAGIPIPTRITAQVVLPATEEDKKGARRNLLIWELTQAVMALGVSAATIFAALRGIESTILSNAFVLIIGLYFVRGIAHKVGKEE